MTGFFFRPAAFRAVFFRPTCLREDYCLAAFLRVDFFRRVVFIVLHPSFRD